MIGVRGTLKDLREQAAALFLEQAAISVLANNPDRFSPQQIQENIEALNSIRNRKELRSLVSRLRSSLDGMRSHYGVMVSRERIFAWIQAIQRIIAPGQVCYVPVGLLAKDLTFYSKMAFPPHTRIRIDPQCVGRDYPNGFEVRSLEVSLYEDMSWLFNLAQECYMGVHSMQPKGETNRKLALKQHAALMRATMSAAFYFVESYINCVAADYLFDHPDVPNEKDKSLLTEWDSTKSRYRFVSTRDKPVNYPRIVTGVAFPPIDENNCPELKYFVTTAKAFRDAIVHASVTFDPIENYPKTWIRREFHCFPSKVAENRRSSPQCLQQSIDFHKRSFNPPGVLIDESDAISPAPTFG